MRYPIIHLNDPTNGYHLLGKYTNQLFSLDQAIEMMEDSVPKELDFLQQRNGQAIFAEAYAEHVDRLRRVRSVREEIRLIADHVQQKITESRPVEVDATTESNGC